MITHDLLGRPATPLELEAAQLYERLLALTRRPDLPPCVAANSAHALAALWQVMNDLDLPCSPTTG